MRAARWFVGLSASFSMVAAVAAGCGGGTNGAAPLDSGAGDVTTDVTRPTMEAAVEAGPDVMEASPPEAAACVPDANLGSLPVPDASIGDAGATAASCLTCFESACPMIVQACNQSCSCVSAYEGFQSCLAAGTSLLSCATQFAGSSGLGIGATQLACAAPCALNASTCGFSLNGGGGDSGTPTGDAATGDAGATTDGATE